jgi:dihydroflavonol-4-reductase
MNIFITGATGFIGGALCRAFSARGDRVFAFHRATSNLRQLEDLPVEHVIGDLTQPATLTAAVQGMDAVFHTAAWVGMNDAGRLYAINVEGTRTVVQAALKAGVKRLVYTSSVAALGIPAPGVPVLLDENHTWNFRPELFPYGYAKYLAELEVQKGVAQGLEICTGSHPR